MTSADSVARAPMQREKLAITMVASHAPQCAHREQTRSTVEQQDERNELLDSGPRKKLPPNLLRKAFHKLTPLRLIAMEVPLET